MDQIERKINMSKLTKIEKYVEKGNETALLKMLRNKDRDVQLAAIDGLGKIGKDTSCNELISMLSDPDWEIRARSARALGNIGDDHTTTHLRYRLEHETEKRVSDEIVEALSKLRKWEK